MKPPAPQRWVPLARGNAILRAVLLHSGRWGPLPSHSMLLMRWGTQTILAAKYKLWNSSLRTLLHLPGTYSYLGPSIFNNKSEKIKILYKHIQMETMRQQEKHRKNKTFHTAIYLLRCITPMTMMTFCGDRESARHTYWHKTFTTLSITIKYADY